MWKKLSSKIILNHPRLTVVEDRVELPNGIVTDYLRYKNTGDAITVICIRPDGKILVQKDYSYPPDRFLLQFPGGSIIKNESPKVAARRELREESGWLVNKLTFIGSYLINNRKSDQKMHVFVAEEISFYKTAHEAEEGAASHSWKSESEIDRLLSRNRVQNVHFLASWTLFKSNRSDNG